MEDARVAAAFASPRSRAILFALMQSEQSLQGLSKRIGSSLSLLHYHVDKLQKLGLVRTVRQDRRAGRPIKFYSTIARSFLVTGDAEVGSSAAGLQAEMAVALERGGEEFATSTLYSVDDDGTPRMLRLPVKSNQGAGGEWWWRLNLTRSEADRLSRELRDLIASYTGRQGKKSGKYLCHIAIARPPNA